MKHNQEIEKKWIEQLKTFETAGLSISQYCKKRQLKEHQFYYWQKKLKRKTALKYAETPHKFIPIIPIQQEPITDSKNTLDTNRMKITVSIEGVPQQTHIEIKTYLAHD